MKIVDNIAKIKANMCERVLKPIKKANKHGNHISITEPKTEPVKSLVWNEYLFKTEKIIKIPQTWKTRKKHIPIIFPKISTITSNKYILFILTYNNIKSNISRFKSLKCWPLTKQMIYLTK